MNAIDLYDGVTDIRDGLVEEAGTHRFHKKARWTRYAALAAAFALVIGVAGVATGRIRIPGLGRSNRGDSGQGGGDGVTWHSYAGPVFPLTALGSADGVTAARSTDFDFSPYTPVRHSYEYNGELHEYDRHENKVIVTDRYVLTNDTDADRTLTLLYPTVATLGGIDSLPTVEADGAAVETAWHAGSYSGGFAPAVGGEKKNPDERLNINEIGSWAEYRALLSDGTYQREAFADLTALPELDWPVTVYKLYDAVVPENAPDATSVQFAADVDGARTIPLSYGFNGSSSRFEEGTARLIHFTRISSELVERIAGRPDPVAYIILLGDDVESYTVQGFRNLSEDRGTEIDVGVTVERYETTLREALCEIVAYRRAVQDSYGPGEDSYHYLAPFTDEEAAGYLVDFMLRYGKLSGDAAERYAFGRIEEDFDSFHVKRVFYTEFAVTVPAHGSVEVAARAEKDASYNYFGYGGMEHNGGTGFIHGYDLATRLGSTIAFTEQRASVSGTEHVALLDSSFGFDLENGVTEVVLDPAREHYWLRASAR